MQITIGIDISKETLAAYRLPDNQRIQVANDRAGQKTLVRWIGKQNGSLVVFEATGDKSRPLSGSRPGLASPANGAAKASSVAAAKACVAHCSWVPWSQRATIRT